MSKPPYRSTHLNDSTALCDRVAAVLALAGLLLLMLWGSVRHVQAVALNAHPIQSAQVGILRQDGAGKIAGIAGRKDDGPPGAEHELAGFLRARPDAPAFGEWQVETAINQLVTVIVTTTTRMDDGLPDVGMWVEVRTAPLVGGALLATRVRPDEFEDQQVVVRLVSGVISTTVADKYGFTPLDTLLGSANIMLFSADDDEETSLQALRHDPDVQWAEVNYVNSIPGNKGYKTWRWGGEDASGYVNQHAFAQVNLTPAFSMTQGAGVVVAVLDTGVCLAHPALAERLIAGWDMVDDDSTPNDDGPGFGWGHGTHVAGIVARMAPQSQIMPVRVLDDNGRGSTFALAYGIEWAVAHGADVINLSLGAEAGSRVLRDVIESALAQGVVIVAAVGNENSNIVQYPAGFGGVIGVAAVDDANVKADFSNFGASWIDLAAPGVGITSTVPYTGGNGYASWSGTSMSTAFVSGAAALVRAADASLSTEQVGAKLRSAAVDLDPFNPDLVGQLGGLLDVAAAVVAQTPDPQPSPQPGATPASVFFLPIVIR
jgi:subtilisin family serine protease